MQNLDEIGGFLRIDPETLMILVIFIFYSVMLHFRVEDSGSPPCLAFF
jgi:hypothetical protein